MGSSTKSTRDGCEKSQGDTGPSSLGRPEGLRQRGVVEVVSTSERALWRSVMVPSEHGGWGLTLEPVLLGLLVAPSVAGGMIGVATFLIFLVRTPLKLVGVDVRRGRWLPRTRMAALVAAFELMVIVVLALGASARAGSSWWIAALVAAPFAAIELWFDVRSRGRRLLPELCGASAVSAAVIAIVLAAGTTGTLAVALWLVLVARAVGAIPFVRTQIVRLRRGTADPAPALWAQAVAIGLGFLAFLVDPGVWLGVGALMALAAVQVAWLGRDPVPAKVLGTRQMGCGLALVIVTAAGAALV